MHITMAIVLRRTGGHLTAYIRLTKNRKQVFVSTKERIDPSYFTPTATGKWVNGKAPNAMRINAVIQNRWDKASREITKAEMDSRDLDLNYLADIVRGKVSPADGSPHVSFLKAINDRAIFHIKNQAAGSYFKYNTLAGNWKLCWGNKDFSPSQVTSKEVEQFRLWRKERGIHDNTIRKDFSFLATVFDTVSEAKNPFRAVKIKPVPSSKERLTPEELAQIEAVKLTGLAGLAKDMFLFAFYCQGMRFQNVALMPQGVFKKDKLNYQMNKGKKFRELDLHPKLKTLYDKYHNAGTKYLFPIIPREPRDILDERALVGSANSEINKYLKVVASAAGIDKNLTFHMSRHTFAYTALTKGVGYAVLKDALGHADYRTTQAYLSSLSDDHINEAVRSVYD